MLHPTSAAAWTEADLIGAVQEKQHDESRDCKDAVPALVCLAVFICRISGVRDFVLIACHINTNDFRATPDTRYEMNKSYNAIDCIYTIACPQTPTRLKSSIDSAQTMI